MAHVDGQQIAALGIVAVAAATLGRRLAAQIAGFRGRGPAAPGCGGCGGACGGSTASAEPAAPRLVQIQLKAPERIRRPQ
jgi:hypothetical protein